MTLNDYIQGVRDAVRDPNANFYTDAQLTRWINRARKQVAKVGQCVRVLPPSLAGVSTITVTSGGSGYVSTPTVTISDPDGNSLNNVTATATATINAGEVTAITVTLAGDGYAETPTVTIDGGGGTGATATATLAGHITTTAAQEVYTFAAITSVVQGLYAGYGELLGIQSISVSQGAMKPTLNYVAWSAFQAYLRSYPYMRTWPVIWSQYGQGSAGSIYVYPVPTQITQMDVDCYFSVADLSASQTVDRLSEPWEEAAIFYAAHLAYINAQRPDDARMMVAEYEAKVQEARVSSDVGRIPSFYPGQMVV